MHFLYFEVFPKSCNLELHTRVSKPCISLIHVYLSFRKTCSEIYYHISLTPNTYQAMFCTVFPLFCTSTFHYWWWSWARVTKGCVSIRHLTPDFPYILMNICIVLKMVYCMKTGVLGTCLYNPRVYFLAFSHFLKYMIALCKKNCRTMFCSVFPLFCTTWCVQSVAGTYSIA